MTDIKPIFDFFRNCINLFISLLSTDIFKYGNLSFSFLHALVGGLLLACIIRLFWKGA